MRGRSGNPQPAGGVIYTIDAGGSVRRVGTSPGAGRNRRARDRTVRLRRRRRLDGRRSRSGRQERNGGGNRPARTNADARGAADGAEPDRRDWQRQSGTGSGAGDAPAGFYVTDTNTRNVYVASEIGARFWILRPQGNRFQLLEFKTDLPAANYNFEGGMYLND